MMKMKYTLAIGLVGALCSVISPIQAMEINKNNEIEDLGKKCNRQVLCLFLKHAGKQSDSISSEAWPMVDCNDPSLGALMKIRQHTQFDKDGLEGMCAKAGQLLTYINNQLNSINLTKKVTIQLNEKDNINDTDSYNNSTNMILVNALNEGFHAFFDPGTADMIDRDKKYTQFKDFRSEAVADFIKQYGKKIDWKNGNDPVSKMLNELNNDSNIIVTGQTLDAVSAELSRILDDAKPPVASKIAVEKGMKWLIAHYYTIVLPLVVASVFFCKCWSLHGSGYPGSPLMTNDVNCIADAPNIVWHYIKAYVLMGLVSKFVSKIYQ